ncbi:hypothetical protein FOVG_19142 [Fusarium oxysporum f. sp. pisi HDV247]|uniref:Uncharacterized protein n=1 Tax=Fusarium oxysporum f. sp. pisi HDV247 TaxID=1080344 RepID=W9NNF1_FUSOX|nr:hypothetical protein FOVG_19142 [Fusarium oxysporum f. sp. pisi HDV247]
MDYVKSAASPRIESKCNEESRNTATAASNGAHTTDATRLLEPGSEWKVPSQFYCLANSSTTYGQLDVHEQLVLSPEPVKRDPARELEIKVLPDRSRICRNAWGLARQIAGPTQDTDVGLSTTALSRAIPYFEELSKFSKESEHEKRFLFLKLLFVAVLLSWQFKQRAKLSYEQRYAKSSRKRIKHPEDCKRVPSDVVLNEMIREHYGMRPDDNITKEPWKRKKAETHRLIQIGSICLKLVKEYGWGALIIPSTLLKREDFNRVGSKQHNRIFEHIKSIYDSQGWREELCQISSTMFVSMTQGIPKGYSFKILTLSKRSAEEGLTNVSLAEWFRFIPSSQVRQAWIPLSRLTNNDRLTLDQIPRPADPDLKQQSYADSNLYTRASSICKNSQSLKNEVEPHSDSVSGHTHYDAMLSTECPKCKTHPFRVAGSADQDEPAHD